MREDPRFRLRRIDVKRSAGRRRLRVVLIASMIGLVFAAGIAALRSPVLDVDRIEVSGIERTTEREVTDVAAIDLGDAMIDVDGSSVAAAIEELPYVAVASVERGWPNTVHITIVEREPMYELISAGEFVVVADDGVVVERSEDPSGLISVVPAETGGHLEVGDLHPLGEVVGELIEGLGTNLAKWVDRVEIEPQRGIVLNLVGSAEAVIGAPLDVEQKLIGLATILGRADLSCVSEIDVQVPDSPIVRRGCSEPLVEP